MAEDREREVMLVGVSLPADAVEFKVPVIPGWKFDIATRQPFGAACIYVRESGTIEGRGGIIPPQVSEKT